MKGEAEVHLFGTYQFVETCQFIVAFLFDLINFDLTLLILKFFFVVSFTSL